MESFELQFIKGLMIKLSTGDLTTLFEWLVDLINERKAEERGNDNDGTRISKV